MIILMTAVVIMIAMEWIIILNMNMMN